MSIKKKKLLKHLFHKDYKPTTFEGLKKAMKVRSGKDIRELNRLLNSLEGSGSLTKTEEGHYSPLSDMGLLTGRVEGHAEGYAFLLPDAPGEADVFIPPEKIGGALHKDKVVVRLTSGGLSGGRRRKGEVVRILERGSEIMVGTYNGNGYQGFVLPDDRHLSRVIKIKGESSSPKIKEGDKVLVRIIRWPDSPQNDLHGEIVEVIGSPGDPGVDITAIQIKYGLPTSFPDNVLKEASGVYEKDPRKILQEEKRFELQSLPMVTIDGADAKDLDDAVSLERTKVGGYSLGVHIADVSYFVREGSALDQEAAKRGTSVYLPDRVIPMLPPQLSNDLCSLNPKTERLAMSVLMELNTDGELLEYKFGPSVICVDQRMTYDEVNGILKGDINLKAKYADLVPMFEDMDRLAGILKKKRVARGALDFSFPEAEVKLDQRGKPLEIIIRTEGKAESIIEEFMLFCNTVVSTHFFGLKVPFIFRVHESPEADKLYTLRDFLTLFDLKLKGNLNKITARQFQEVMNAVKGNPTEKIVNHVLLRSMPQARYSERPLGHFGLAAKYYSHFTAPIRRYPDLLVHRIMRSNLQGTMSDSDSRKLASKLPQLAEQASMQERNAMEAERECLDLKKVEYMEGKEGTEYTGTISGVTSFGFFVELDNTVEGLVHVTDLTDDYYYFDEKRYFLTGERSQKKYQLGDPIKVQLTKVDKEQRTINFIPR
jgi:ribonuclease R